MSKEVKVDEVWEIKKYQVGVEVKRDCDGEHYIEFKALNQDTSDLFKVIYHNKGLLVNTNNRDGVWSYGLWTPELDSGEEAITALINRSEIELASGFRGKP